VQHTRLDRQLLNHAVQLHADNINQAFSPSVPGGFFSLKPEWCEQLLDLGGDAARHGSY
jgi:hypothetical protein